MTSPSVPIMLDQEYRLRFAQSDLLAVEERLGSVFSLFNPEKMGFNTARVLIWRGLHNEIEGGSFVHVFPLTPKGLEQAGEFVMQYVQNDGSFGKLFDQLAPGFGAALGKGKTKGSGEGVTEKNP